MKKGQLMSQPFVFIFMVVVIAMVFLFGSYMVYRLMKTGCQVENQKFLTDFDKEVNRIYSMGFAGSSEECAIVQRYGQTDLQCEILKPSGVTGICFVDMGSSFSDTQIIAELKDELKVLKGNTDDNLFFSAKEGCQMDSRRISKLDVKDPICIRTSELKPVKFILENQGKKVAIKKA